MRCEDAFNATYGLLELHEAAIFKVSFLSLLIGCVLCNEVLQLSLNHVSYFTTRLQLRLKA